MTLPTYLGGALQVKAFRSLQSYVQELLQKFNLNPTQWFILGLVQENKAGVQFSELAAVLGVETPLVTMLANKLEKRQLVKRVAHPSDKRAKLLVLTASGAKLFPIIERTIQQGLKEILGGVSRQEMELYTKILETIVDNTSAKSSNRSSKKNSRHA